MLRLTAYAAARRILSKDVLILRAVFPWRHGNEMVALVSVDGGYFVIVINPAHGGFVTAYGDGTLVDSADPAGIRRVAKRHTLRVAYWVWRGVVGLAEINHTPPSGEWEVPHAQTES